MRIALYFVVMAVLLLANVYQNQTIIAQQKLIREMVGNPSCMVGR